MKKTNILKITTSVLLITLLFSNTVMAATPNNNLKVTYDLANLQEQATYLENILKSDNLTDEVYNAVKEDYDIVKSILEQSNSGVTTFSTTMITYLGDMDGSGAFHLNYSSTYDNHYASVNTKYLGLCGLGYDFNTTAKSVWLGDGTLPGQVYSLKNSMGMTIHGVNVSGSLDGISISGATSASDTVVNTNYNTSLTTQTVDSFVSSIGALNIDFLSSSTAKIYENSTQDTVSSMLKAIL